MPFWAKDLKIGDRMINARAETVAEKPAYRKAFKKHRCLLPVTAFYEWERVPDKPKQPWLFSPADGEPLAFAGLWETWRDPEEDDPDPVRSTTIVTTSANEVMAPVHDRMPVILPERAWDQWLDPENHDTGALQKLLVPAADGVLERRPVSTRVNNARNQGPELVEAISLPD
ncbi:MAG: SOS response-associated peptidase [Acidimicrobiia bacterium]|nr:SOS response-associated peptidase [Acidimicrobiia bacterium]